MKNALWVCLCIGRIWGSFPFPLSTMTEEFWVSSLPVITAQEVFKLSMSQKYVSWNSPELYDEKVLMSAPAKLSLSTLLLVINQESLLTDMLHRSVRFLCNDPGNSSQATTLTKSSPGTLTQGLGLPYSELFPELQGDRGIQKTPKECWMLPWLKKQKHANLSVGLAPAMVKHATFWL